MTTSVVLAVVLGAALLGAIAALLLEQRKSAPPVRHRKTAGPAVAGPEALEAVDLGLRVLTASCARDGRELPDAYVVVCSQDRLVLRLARFDATAPAPWETDDTGEEWSVDRKDLASTGKGPGVTHPYALTVTLGLADGERILVDLTRASAPIALTGTDGDVRALARAFVTELLTGPVGRGAEVTLVGSIATGALSDCLGVRSARLHTAANLGEALALGAGHDPAASFAIAAVPAAEGVTEVFQLIEGGPSGGGGRHTPRLFVMDATQFGDLVHERDLVTWHRADSLLLLGDVPGAAWRFAAEPGGALGTGPLGLAIDTDATRLA